MTGRLLVVDDDPRFLRIAVRCLERAGYECFTAESGDGALRGVVEYQPDAIVLDVMLPPPDGIEVCRRLRSEAWSGGVVVVSARTSPTDRAAATRVGADAFLGKPFPLGELVAAVNALVLPAAGAR